MRTCQERIQNRIVALQLGISSNQMRGIRPETDGHWTNDMRRT